MAVNDVYLRPDAGDGANGVRLRQDAPDIGAVNYTLAGALGSYTLSGQAASFRINRLLSGAAGSYAVSGQAAGFKVSRFLSGSAGSYALTGIAATLAYTPGSSAVAYSLSGAAGLYVFSGQNAVFAYTSTATPSIGGGSGASYNSTNLDLSQWQKNKKRLKKRIKAVEEKIERKRIEMSLRPAIDATQKLMALQQQHLRLLSLLDELNKQAIEESDVMAIYLAYRRLH